jgi:hypothetical protein
LAVQWAQWGRAACHALWLSIVATVRPAASKFRPRQFLFGEGSASTGLMMSWTQTGSVLSGTSIHFGQFRAAAGMSP